MGPQRVVAKFYPGCHPGMARDGHPAQVGERGVNETNLEPNTVKLVVKHATWWTCGGMLSDLC